MRSIVRPLLWILLLLLAGGCISNKTVLNKYYLIELIEPDSSSPGDSRTRTTLIDKTCEIEEIEVSSLIDRSQIINRSRSHELTYYQSHLWATRPSVAFADAILMHIEASGLFREVSDRYSRTLPDLRLGTAIRHLEVLEDNGDFKAHLSMEFNLTSEPEGLELATYSFDRTEPLENRDLNLFAQQISHILYEELNRLIGILEQEVPAVRVSSGNPENLRQR